ncbi:LysR family transcriptional regulator [Kutzneria sp. NPDC052558]|uniref:LysR family transcriptional regulator n=1 Tax=Kutzneria sp. NPDC052558 TaxID=3364121 RepID=UPI0037C722A4
MNLDLFRLRVFVTVVDSNGYSAAARRLDLTQSTVSHHVAELERSCGATLLDYRSRAVHLTASGREVYRAALAMLIEQDRLRASLDDLTQGRHGRVRLGVSMAFEQKHFFRAVIAPFCRAHKGTLLSLRFGHSRREAQAVLDRELDLAYVIRWHLPTGVEFEPLTELRLGFLVTPDHPLAATPRPTVAEIAAAGLITAPLTSAETGFYLEALRAAGISGDRSVLEIDGLQSRVLAAAAGLGVLATFLLDGATVSDDLVVLASAAPLPQVEVGLVRRPGEPLSGSMEALASWLR